MNTDVATSVTVFCYNIQTPLSVSLPYPLSPALQTAEYTGAIVENFARAYEKMSRKITSTCLRLMVSSLVLPKWLMGNSTPQGTYVASVDIVTQKIIFQQTMGRLLLLPPAKNSC